MEGVVVNIASTWVQLGAQETSKIEKKIYKNKDYILDDVFN